MARTQAENDALKKRGVHIGRDSWVADGVKLGDDVRIGSHVNIGPAASIGAGTRIGPGVKIPADSQVPCGTKLDHSNAKRYAMQEPRVGLEPTVTPEERAEKVEIAKERSGAGVAVRGAGRPAGDEKPQKPTPADRTPSSARDH